MNKMNKLFPLNGDKHHEDSEDVVALVIEKANRKKDDMRKRHEEQIRVLENDTSGTRAVMQAMVLVARVSPNEFFALLEEEAEQWNLADLKYVAAAIQNQLQSAKELQQQHRGKDEEKQGELGGEDNQVSTAQRLYSYVMMDPQAAKKTAVQVIKELHKELSLLEEAQDHAGNDIQSNKEDAPGKIVAKGSTESTATSATEELEPKMETNL